MKTIYKYELLITDEQKVLMLKGANILTAQNQDEMIHIWAEVDIMNALGAENEYEYRYFDIFGTGNLIIEELGVVRKYINTVQINGFVWHIFERL